MGFGKDGREIRERNGQSMDGLKSVCFLLERSVETAGSVSPQNKNGIPEKWFETSPITSYGTKYRATAIQFLPLVLLRK